MRHINHIAFVNILLTDKNFFIELFKDVTTFREFLKRINAISEKSFETLGFNDRFQSVGDLFEIFAEIFFIVNEADNRIGVCNYKPVKKSEDNGVDGYGTGIDGKPATIQVKFRADETKELLERDIKQFGFSSIVEYSVDKDTKTNMIIFTSAKGLHWYTESKVFSNRMRIINYEMISKLIDNNFGFWNSVEKVLKESTETYF